MNLAYSPWGTGDTVGPFSKLFNKAWNAHEKGLDGADCFLLWGGTDIHPSYYGETPHSTSQAGKNPSARDVWEWEALIECKEKDIPVIGVCRGAQLLCAFNGGSLYQHVNGHHSEHELTTADGRCFIGNSCHHQMLDVKGTNHELLAWTTLPQSSFYYKTGYASHAVSKEPEVVSFYDNNSLAIQGHPEWMARDSEFVLFCLEEASNLLSKVCIC